MNVIVIVVFVVVALSSAIGTWLRVKRRGDAEDVATRAGLEFAADDPFNSTRVGFSLFTRGDGRGAENVMWRANDGGKPVRAFDFWYYTEHRDTNGRKNRSYEHFTCAMALINGSWPSLTIGREGIFDKVISTLGLPDLDFESEEFNKLFVVRCEDRKFASALIDPQMMDFLLSTHGELGFEFRGRWLLVSTRRIRPALMPGLMRVCDEIVARVPPVVWELYPTPFVDQEGKPLGVEDEMQMAVAPEMGAFGDPFDVLEKNPFDALHDPSRPDYDLDGQVVAPVQQDPWRDAGGDEPSPSQVRGTSPQQ